MAGQLSSRSDFTETFAIHLALKGALRSRLYRDNPEVLRSAERLSAELEGKRSIFGRQLEMIRLMARGATLRELCRKLRCSRRTIYRYLNQLEDAGISIRLEEDRYVVDRSVTQMLQA